MAHTTFATTGRGIDRNTPPMILFEKAKRLGVWNPADIDLSQDQRDWQGLAHHERELFLHLTAQFQAGEEAVTVDLLPLIQVIASSGRIEEELYLASFLWEEAKHCDFFHRFFTIVAPDAGDLTRFHGPNYRAVFYEALPDAMQALEHDPSPVALARASTTYNLIVEGVLAETGYYAYFKVMDENGILPGHRKGISLLKQDESRHIAYGIYLLSRLMAENETTWEVIERTMNHLLPLALGVVDEALAAYDPVPFGIQPEEIHAFAATQFQKRLARIERARGATFEEVCRVQAEAIENEDA